MRLPRDSSSVAPGMAVSAPHHPASSSSGAPFKMLGNKENVQPPEGGGGEAGAGSEASAAANLLWLLDFRLDNLLPNDGNAADKMAHSQGNTHQASFHVRKCLAMP